MHTLIPNASSLAKHLTMFAEACNATEVIMFERTTFLVIATSSSSAVSSTLPTAITSTDQFLETSNNSISLSGNGNEPTKELVISDAQSTSSDSTAQPDGHLMEHARYERTSEIIKSFKHSCSKWREEFFCHEMEFPDFTLVLDELTRNTYIMVVVHDPTIGVLSCPFQASSEVADDTHFFRNCSHKAEYSISAAEVRGYAERWFMIIDTFHGLGLYHHRLIRHHTIS